MIHEMKISVIIPTYKPQSYLDECLESLEGQTFDKGDYEVLVILNGEKDPYATDIQGKLRGYSFCSRFFYASDAGVSNARNIGLGNARGEYICFIDDDDFVSPAYLEGLYRTAAGHPGAIAVSNVATFVHRNDKKLGKDYISLAFDRFSNNPTNSLFKKRKFLSSSWCKLIPTGMIRERRFDAAFRVGEDALFMFEISDKIQDIALSQEDVLYYRRLRSGSASRKTYSVLSKAENRIRLVGAYISLYVKGITRYNVLFFLSRIVAVIKSSGYSIFI